MQRAALERLRTLHTWRAHLLQHDEPALCVCEQQPGRFRKSQRIGGCGRPRCWLCHGEKLAGRPKPRQRLDRHRYREGVAAWLQGDFQ